MDSNQSFDDNALLEIALEEAMTAQREGAQPVGAVIVDAGGGILARGHNRVLTSGDITIHAEIDAIRRATFTFGERESGDECAIYVTAEPCFMCLGGIMLCPIDRIIWALDSPIGSPFEIVTHSSYWGARVKRLSAVSEPDPSVRDESRELLIEWYSIYDPERAEAYLSL